MAVRYVTALSISCLWILFGLTEGLMNLADEQVCTGTSQGLVARGNPSFRYKTYKLSYTNCTYVAGNLEIVFLDEHRNYNLSFLENIKEVTGYVLIVGVYARHVPLTSLKIIRGKTLYDHEGMEYSLFVALNHLINNPDVGLHELSFKNLQEILRGKVYFHNNNLLCYENTIDWTDINPGLVPPVIFKHDSNDYKRQCGECDPACYQPTTKSRHCWGAGPNMCQKLSQGEECAGSCDGRCYGKLPNQCCHGECAGGCSGPKKTDCLACRNFMNDGACVPYCPQQYKYDLDLDKMVPNPDAKYTIGSLCVPKCPDHLLLDRGACVRSCPEGKSQSPNNTCEPCVGACPRACKGLGDGDFLNAHNVNNFSECTSVDGNIKILRTTFLGDVHREIPPLQPSQLDALKDVREISEYLTIQAMHVNFTSLAFLSNLELVHGRALSYGNAISVMMTSLERLELTSLKKVKYGDVTIIANRKLCLVDSVNWSAILYSPKQKANIKANQNQTKCEKDHVVCDAQCRDGCWGLGPDKCVHCKHLQLAGKSKYCVASCSDVTGYYEDNFGMCQLCNVQCNGSCSGPDSSDCFACRNVTMLRPGKSNACLAACPQRFYPDPDRICRPCYVGCEGGCTGPDREVAQGGCSSCSLGVRERDGRVFCLPHDTDACDAGYYLQSVSFTDFGPMAGKKICEPCHDLCRTCNGPSVHYCNECVKFSDDGICVAECQGFKFPNNDTKQCHPCHQECRRGCDGPSSAHCFACTNMKVYLDPEGVRFNCTPECPESLPYQVSDLNVDGSTSHTVCADSTHPEVVAKLQKYAEDEKKKIGIISGAVIGGLFLVGCVIVGFAYHWHKRAKAKEKTVALTVKLSGYEETEPLTPTTAKPDLARLRLIKESELRRGGIIGSGAFGTVYKGYWIPEGENVKIPVAIKVLQEGTPNQNKELLEEARVMTSVEHPCCVRILAVCMTVQMMLITQLMPLGCLLDYVRKNKDHVGSKVLLNWCTQIARGMIYLEERGIVHRDLAARNVLVQNPTQVKITDFGLAKLLDYNEDEYRAAGGKMPIKWLALECIQHRIFTHKSDVWSFGVTVWELFTYGQKPYDNIRARDVPDLLEKGERLNQPPICTIDVYMIMIKCWMLDAESRPSFKELAEEFAKMSRDPGRYLVIQGDVLKRIPDQSQLISEIDLIPGDSSDLHQGDELMRLPSHSYDKNDLVRSLSLPADGPEEVIEADDYLQPQADSLAQGDSLPRVKGAAAACHLDVKPVGKEGGGRPVGKEGGVRPWREKRYAHLESAAEARSQRLAPTRGRGDSVSSRYSSDPVRFFKYRDQVDLMQRPFEDCPFYNGIPDAVPSSPSPPPPLKSDMPLHIPVDEDDYLQPKSSRPVAYMDLSDRAYYENEQVFEEPEETETDKMLPQPNGSAVDNPEYFDKVEENPWTDSRPKQNGLHPLAMAKPPPAVPTPKPRERNYYNDVGRPEAKPLVTTGEVHSESTV